MHTLCVWAGVGGEGDGRYGVDECDLFHQLSPLATATHIHTPIIDSILLRNALRDVILVFSIPIKKYLYFYLPNNREEALS